jgi:transcriptional regulator with XRE-family HTH domain
MTDTNNMLSLLEGFTLTNAEDIAMDIAKELRQRRIEKNLTRNQLAERARVPASNVARFEQKGLISLQNLISLAMAMGYTSEIRHIFSQPKYSTMEELDQIRRNSGKKKAHRL